MEKKWWKEAVVYQIYPRSFKDSNGDGIGDLRGIIEKLDYLKDLGISVIWISPIYPSPNKDNGYDISNYRGIMPEFGTMEDFDILLEEIHHRDMKLVLDLVVNHTSDQHPWFIESRKSKDNPYRDYYIWKEPRAGKEPTNWGAYFSGSAWQYDETTKQYYLHQFVPEQPDLNWENPRVRKEIFDMMHWWCQKGVDGFRMDVISLISKPEVYIDGILSEGELYAFCGNITANGPRVHEYLQEMNREVLSHYDLITVGETTCVTLEEAKKYARSDGKELNMIFQFEHMDIDSDERGKWTDKSLYLPDLKRVMNHWQRGLEDIAWNSLYWNNHDQPRIVSRWGDDSEAYREVSAKMLATCLHMMQGTPYIYQGEELGMTNMHFQSIDECDDIEEKNIYQDLVAERKIYTPEKMLEIISKKGRDNARTPMQWNAEKNAGFSEGTPWLAVNPNYITINVREQIGNEDSIYHYYRKLIALRREKEIVVYGKYRALEEEHENLFIYTREWDRQRLLIICNFSKEEQEIPESIQYILKGDTKILLSNYDTSCEYIRGYEARVYEYMEKE